MFILCDEMTVKSHRWQEQCSECKPSDRCLLWLKVEACTCVWIISLITRGKLKIITPVDLKTKQCIWIQLTVLVLWFINLGAARCIVANTWKWPQTPQTVPRPLQTICGDLRYVYIFVTLKYFSTRRCEVVLKLQMKSRFTFFYCFVIAFQTLHYFDELTVYHLDGIYDANPSLMTLDWLVPYAVFLHKTFIFTYWMAMVTLAIFTYALAFHSVNVWCCQVWYWTV